MSGGVVGVAVCEVLGECRGVGGGGGAQHFSRSSNCVLFSTFFLSITWEGANTYEGRGYKT